MAGPLKYVLFISYADADYAWVEGFLLPTLGLPGKSVITKEDFLPGADKVSEFARAVTNSRYTVVVLSPAFLTDVWATVSGQMAAYLSVDEQRDRLIPLLLRPCTPPLIADSRVALDCTDEAQWAREIARLHDLLDQPEPEPERTNCPYPGMVPFSAEDARFFYGRDSETRQLLQQLRHHRMLFVIGPSGSGKSSLVFAGLLPRLHQSTLFPRNFWLVRDMRPGSQPTLVLSHLLGGDLARPAETIEGLLETHLPAKRLLLIVDQFEETFTQAARDEQGCFISALQALSSIENCVLLIVMRADFYPDLMNSDLWPVGAGQRLEIAPLRGEMMRKAIQQPAADVGVYLEPGLLERLLSDAAYEPGALPLLQETMVLLWSDMRRRLLSLSAYEQLGGERRSGLAVAIARKADATLVTLTPNQQTIARRIFLRLVQFVEGRDDIRRQQPVKALWSAGDAAEEFETTLEHLTRNRLLTLSGEEQGGDRKVDIGHEALISGWPTLQGWLRERREAEQIRRRLESKTTDWLGLDRRGGLLDEAELLEAERWFSSPAAADLGYDEALPALIQASRESHRRARHLRFSVIGIVFTLIIAILSISLFGQYQIAQEQRKRVDDQATAVVEIQAERDAAQDAEGTAVAALAAEAQARQDAEAAAIAEAQARQIAFSRQLAAQALTHLEAQLDLALLLSVEAYQTANTFEARSSLLTGLEHSPFLASFLRGHTASVTSVAFSPDGKMLASSGSDNIIILWDVATRQPLGQPLADYTDSVSSVAFSPDGRLLAWGNADHTIILWDVVTGQPAGQPLTGPTGPVGDITFSPDSKTLAASSCGSTSWGFCMETEIRLWDVATRQLLGQPLTCDAYSVGNVAFSPDGKTLALGCCAMGSPLKYSFDCTKGEIRLWDVATRQLLGQPLTGHIDNVNSVAFSPDGRILASGSADGIILWDVVARQPAGQSLTGYISWVNSMAFSPDGKRLASSSADGIILWDVATRRPLDQPLPGHTGLMHDLAFSPDGQMLVSGGQDGTMVLWDLSESLRVPYTFLADRWQLSRNLFSEDFVTRQPLGQPLIGHDSYVYSMAFSPDGKMLASSGSDGIILWDIATREPLGQPLIGYGMAFSQDGEVLALANKDGTIILWDVTARRPLSPPLVGHTGEVTGLAFSPDGKMLASSGADGIILWDVATRRPLDQPLIDHDSYAYSSMAFSPDGKMLASSHYDGIILWNINARQPISRSLTSPTGPVTSIAFSPDGKTLASGHYHNTIILWDVVTGQPAGQPLTGPTGPVTSITFSPDGTTLASGSCRKEEAIFCLYGEIFLWDVTARQPLSPPLVGHTGEVTGLAFSPDGKMLASRSSRFDLLGGEQNTLILWDTDLESWQARACSIANRNLSREEWRRYIGEGEPYRPTCSNIPAPEK